ncbi:NAD(P)/FAD-dependent oxidoreductase [Neoroseomonas lacus]|nr:FAD-dependent oxidoreductase [Neoroseomonas lacus]
MKLRTGVPLWLAYGTRAPAATPLGTSLNVDVAVIGGGISGALVTDALLQAGLSVAVFDRVGFVRGSTPASTAMLQFEIDQPLTLLRHRIGPARAARAWWRSASGVTRLHSRIADLGLRCDFRERHTAYLPGNVLDFADLRSEAAARERIGLRSILIDRATLKRFTGIDKPGAIWSAGSAEVDPAKLARGLWRSAAQRGAMLHAPVDIIDIAPGRRRVTLSTDTDHSISARSVVLATGYALTKLLKPRGYRVISTWAMATAPQSEALWPSRCLIWEASDPYLYCRTTRDGRVVAGGEDEAFEDEAKRDALIPAKMARIGRKLKRLLPKLDTAPDYAWAGCFGESAIGLPAIGEVPGAPRCYAVMGFGGNGITFSAIAAEIIQRAILGLPDPDTDLFRFG